MAALFRRLLFLLRRSRYEADLRDEINTHRSLRQAQLERDGMDSTDAILASLRAVGNVTLARDDSRQVWVWPWLESVSQDVRVGCRMLLTRRAVALTAILSLAIGIGANSAVFSLVNGLLLRPLPYPDPDQLVLISAVSETQPDRPQRTNAPDYLAWQERATSFEAMGFDAPIVRDLGADDNSGVPAERVRIQRYTASLFQVLRVRPAIGRVITAGEDRIGAPAPVAILSDAFWLRRFNRNRDAIGKTLRIDGTPTTIIGVMPPDFTYRNGNGVDLWMPFAFNRAQVQDAGRGYSVAARLKPSATIAQAQAEMDAIAAQLANERPARNTGWGVRIDGLHEAFTGGGKRPLMLLQGIVGVVLLIACFNVASLLLAAATGRRTEIALRAAIGAGRARIIRLLLTESALLALAGGAAGVIVAWGGLKALRVFTAGLSVSPGAIAIDGAVLAFTIVTSVVTCLVFGLAPAFHSSRPGLIESLKGPATGAVEAPTGRRLRGALVVAEISLALVLLTGAGLLINSFARLNANDLGGDPSGILAFSVSFQGPRFNTPVGSHAGFPLVEISPVVSTTFQRIWEEIQVLPGVRAAAGINHTPFTATAQRISFTIAEATTGADGMPRRSLAARSEFVTPRFFETMRIPFVRGRDFNEADTATSPWSVVVSETMAREVWPNQNPIGQQLTLGVAPGDRPREVIGVVRDARTALWQRDPVPVMYTLHRQQPAQNSNPFGNDRVDMTFLVRAADTGAAIDGIHRVMTGIDRDRPISDVHPLARDVAAQIAWNRNVMTLLSVAAAAATLLAAIGVYGLFAHDVSRRVREIGIRMALGARSGQVLGLVLKHAALLIACGLVAGLAGSLALTRLISSQLWGVTATDALTYFLVSVVMLLVGLLASYVPGRRATRIAPTVALRCE